MKKTLKLFALILVAAQLLAFTVTAADVSTGFVDVKSSRWSYANIKWAVDNGYMNGVGDGKFSPAGTTTRAMVVTVLYRLAGSPKTVYTDTFKDVPAGKWFTDAVVWAAKAGVVNGTSATTFAPNANITREQLAAIFYRYADFDYVITDGVKADLSVYKDVKKVSSYAKDAMAWANKVGLVNGVTADTLNPKGNATREQFAAILNRYATCEDFTYRVAYNEPVLKSTYTEPEYPLVNDADVYVSATGSDSNPGTLDKPVKTFEKARDLVRGIKKTKTTGEIKVAFKAGNYGKLDDFVLTSEDKGSADCPITYCKYGDGEVIFDNGFSVANDEFQPLTDAEKSMFPAKSADKIKKISLNGYFDAGLPFGITLYDGTTACIVARNPDKSGTVDNYIQGSIDTVDGDAHYPGMLLTGPLKREIDKCDNVDNMKIYGYIVRGYRVDSFYVTGYDKSTGILSIDPEREVHPEYKMFGVRTPGLNHTDMVYVENNPKFLNSAGEYWCDTKTNTLYVYDPQDDFSAGIDGRFLTLDDADYVNLLGLTFKNCFNECAITVHDSEHVTVDRVKVEGVTGKDAHEGDSGQGLVYPGTNTVLSIVGECDWLTVTRCEFSKFKNHGIDLYPIRDAVHLYDNHIVIDNTYFPDCGNGTTFMDNVIIDRSVGTVFSHNVFRNSESGAFDLGTCGIIEYNVFDNMMTSTHDYGCIYTQQCNGVLSRGNIIRYNIFNQKVQNGANYSIYLDDSTTAMQVYGNIFCGSTHHGVVIHNSRSHEVHDNLFIDAQYVISGMITVDENGKLYEGISPIGEGGGFWQWNGMYQMCMNQHPKEGEPGYEEWKERFPDLYKYYVDLDDLTGQYNLACPYNEIYDNIDIVDEDVLTEDRQHSFLPYSGYAVKVGKIYNNRQFLHNENPGFVNPAHGDYTVKDGVDIKIPFEKIGQY